MTSTNSSFSLGKNLWRQLKSNWWFALITLLAGILAGPLVDYFIIRNLPFQYSGEALTIANLSWEILPTFIPCYVLAFAAAFILALRLSAYQHNRRQIDHYHALPVTRQGWLTLHFLTAIVLFAAVLLVLLALKLAVAFTFMHGYYSLYLSWYGIHFVQILLTFFLTFVLTMLAGQLTGHILAQAEMALLLQFGIPGLSGLFFALFSALWPTFTTISFLKSMVYWSPLSVLFCMPQNNYNPANYPSSSDYLANTPLPFVGLKPFILMLAVSAAAAVLTFVLYRRRPLERGGQTFIHAFTALPVRAYLIFVVALVFSVGIYTLMDQNFILLILSFVIFSILVHLFCAISFNRDVRSFGKKIPLTAILALLTLAFVFSVRADVYGFNRYVPDTGKVNEVSLTISGLPNQLEDVANLKNEQTVELANQLAKNSIDHLWIQRDHPDQHPQTVSLTYDWTLKNGKKVSRVYAITKNQLDQLIPNLYNQKEFRQALWTDLFNGELTSLNYSDITIFSDTNSGKPGAPTHDLALYDTSAKSTTKTPEHKARAQELISALQKDLANRRFEDLNASPVGVINISTNHPMPDGESINILPSDVYTRAVLEKYRSMGLLAPYEPDLAGSVVKTLEVRTMFPQDADPAAVKDGTQAANYEKLVATITDPAEIQRILTQDSISIDFIGNLGVFIDDRYIITSPDNLLITNRAFFAGKVPAHISSAHADA